MQESPQKRWVIILLCMLYLTKQPSLSNHWFSWMFLHYKNSSTLSNGLNDYWNLFFFEFSCFLSLVLAASISIICLSDIHYGSVWVLVSPLKCTPCRHILIFNFHKIHFDVLSLSHACFFLVLVAPTNEIEGNM